MIDSGFQELLEEFLLEARERADEVESALLQLTSGDAEARAATLAKAKRELHTLKGNAGMMGFTDLQQLSHLMEDQVEALDIGAPQVDELLAGIDALRQGLEEVSAGSLDAGAQPAAPRTAEPRTGAPEEPAGSPGAKATGAPAAAPGPRPSGAAAEGGISSVRVPFSKIDQLVEMQAESVIFRNRLSDAIHKGMSLVKQIGGDPAELLAHSGAAWELVEEGQQALEKVLNLLQEQVMDLGMVPLRGLFRSLRRIVHDESGREGKSVELEIAGGETPIDKTLLEAAGDALGHLVRNAVIHGIERPADRRRAGKGEIGKVRVTAALEANEIWIEITDDGAGIDLATLRAQAERARGPEAELGSDFALLFAEGVSTRAGADLGAGRGVGLSAVKKSVEGHGGRITVTSARGLGTTFTLRLPLTASILRSLALRADGEEYALPLTAVAATFKPAPRDRHEINRAGVVRWRGRVVPLLDLGCAFGTASSPRAGGLVVMMEVNGRYRALATDEIVGIHDIVVKGLDSIVGEPVGISGSTILGDGRVILILDPTALATIPPFTASER